MCFKEFQRSRKRLNNIVLLNVDVNVAWDINFKYDINSVIPSLLYFENGQLKNIIKGCHQPEQFNAIFKKMYIVFGVAITINNNKM